MQSGLSCARLLSLKFAYVVFIKTRCLSAFKTRQHAFCSISNRYAEVGRVCFRPEKQQQILFRNDRQETGKVCLRQGVTSRG
jgi:hypothetical protein